MARGHRRKAVADLTIVPSMIERRGTRPSFSDDIELRVGSRIALRLSQKVAIVAARDRNRRR